ncbi:hypothetical protein SEA_BOBBY_171 [Mycobacterium phage Bobby]|nr:hypothetical protein SEA_BOBBY_171 [Mycobacterium phage Bobby]
MKLYRKRPVVIEAMQWATEDDDQAIAAWIEDHHGTVYRDPDLCGACGPSGEDWGSFEIVTLEGDMEVSPFDFVIRGVSGEFYPCKPDIFALTYEEA